MMILLINQDLIVNEFPYLYYASKTIDIDDYIPLILIMAVL